MALSVNTVVLSKFHNAWYCRPFLCQTGCNHIHISRIWQKCLLQKNQLILLDLRILFWEAQFWSCLSFLSQILTVKTQKVLLNYSYCLGHLLYLLNISISKATLGLSSELCWGHSHHRALTDTGKYTLTSFVNVIAFKWWAADKGTQTPVSQYTSQICFICTAG